MPEGRQRDARLRDLHPNRNIRLTRCGCPPPLKASETTVFETCWAVLRCTGKAVKYR